MATFVAHRGRVAPALVGFLIALVGAHLSRLPLIPIVGIRQLVAPQLFCHPGWFALQTRWCAAANRTMRYVGTRSSVYLLCGPVWWKWWQGWQC